MIVGFRTGVPRGTRRDAPQSPVRQVGDQLTRQTRVGSSHVRRAGSLRICCESRLSQSTPPRWRPRSAAPELVIHWNNLCLWCSTIDTINNRKDSRPLKAKVPTTAYLGPPTLPTSWWSAAPPRATCTTARTSPSTNQRGAPSNWQSTTVNTVANDAAPSSTSISRHIVRAEGWHWTASGPSWSATSPEASHQGRIDPSAPTKSLTNIRCRSM